MFFEVRPEKTVQENNRLFIFLFPNPILFVQIFILFNINIKLRGIVISIVHSFNRDLKNKNEPISNILSFRLFSIYFIRSLANNE